MAQTKTTRKILIAINIVALVGLIGATGYLFVDNRDLRDQASLTSEEQNRRLVEEINQVFDLPEEDPVVAIVTDIDEFKAEYTSFDNAKEGDYLLFFRKNRLNVLYRQSEGRVVKTADVAVPIAIELIGSQAAVDGAEEKLTEFGNQVTITKKVDTSITQSFVFDIDGDQTTETQSIAELLGIDVGSTLPSTIQPATQTEVVIAVTESVEFTPSPAETEGN